MRIFNADGGLLNARWLGEMEATRTAVIAAVHALLSATAWQSCLLRIHFQQWPSMIVSASVGDAPRFHSQ